MKVVFLYTRLADYFLRCVQHLVQEYEVACFIFNNPPDKDAPYQFQDEANITILDRTKFDAATLFAQVQAIQPDIIYASGWADKDYRKIMRAFSPKIPVIIGTDNHWEGTWKQRIATWISPFYLRPLATHIWAAGMFQYEYARRLGFAESQILMGLYCANYPAFSALYPQRKQHIFTKTLLYVGRFVGYKKPDWLLACFMELEEEGFTDWKLLMIGEGPMKEELIKTAKGNVTIKGFVHPKELPTLFGECGVFCLPAEREHWGVVVHEAAAAGMPMILSDTCGAGNTFLVNGYNGFVYETGNKNSLKMALRKLMTSDENHLQKMAEHSYQLSQRITLDTWAGTLMSVITK